MSEVFLVNHELLPAHAVIGSAFYDWLELEVKGSTLQGDPNAYLGNMDTYFRDGQQKASAHYSRTIGWTEEFAGIEQHPGYASNEQIDYAIARQLFGVCMGLSGSYRSQCALLAVSQMDYNRRRMERPLGIDITQTTTDRLERHFGEQPAWDDLQQQILPLDDLTSSTLRTNNGRHSVDTRLFEDIKRKKGFRKVHHAARLVNLQRAWLDLGVDYVLYAAQKRGGDITKVPFLTPVTITQANVYYPFDPAAIS